MWRSRDNTAANERLAWNSTKSVIAIKINSRTLVGGGIGTLRTDFLGINDLVGRIVLKWVEISSGNLHFSTNVLGYTKYEFEIPEDEDMVWVIHQRSHWLTVAYNNKIVFDRTLSNDTCEPENWWSKPRYLKVLLKLNIPNRDRVYKYCFPGN